jgi:hypothetical protein
MKVFLSRKSLGSKSNSKSGRVGTRLGAELGFLDKFNSTKFALLELFERL